MRNMKVGEAGQGSRFCEVKTAVSADSVNKATVTVSLGNIYIEVRDADTRMIQEYLLEVLAQSC